MKQPQTNVVERLRQLHHLSDGWIDGQGRKPPVAGLIWLQENWTRYWNSDLPTPFVYPTLAGGVQMEWSIGDVEASLDVSVTTGSASFLACRVTSSGDIEDLSIVLDLHQPGQWELLNHSVSRLNRLFAEAA